MTFDEMVTEISERLQLSSPETLTRIGRELNVRYRRVTSSCGIANTSRRTVATSTAATVGNQYLTFTGVEKLVAVYDLNGSDPTIMLEEKTVDYIRGFEPTTGDPTMWANYRVSADTVIILMDCLAQSTFSLTADAFVTATELYGELEPAFSESFHDILIEGVMADELRKQEKGALAKVAEDTFKERLAELRLFLATSAYLRLQQGGRQPKRRITGRLA